ncbi:MAG: class I SAM-dependent methyltransferase [Flavobacteriales bacterium]|nr:class I SAM-dependent methyltransferase [Flavobacteriales bacterium]
MNSSKDYYDSIAQDYSAISAKRKPFLDQVNALIVANSPKRLDYADIGAGDGARSHVIAQGLQARTCTLIDESAELLDKVPSDLKTAIIQGSITELDLDDRFDVVTCLWNVLGHLPDLEQRDEAVRRIARSVRPGGLAFVDVNNRYNIQEYGLENVMRNVEADARMRDGRGWYPIAQSNSETKVYIHGPFELDPILERSGFEIVRRFHVDYLNGELHLEFWKGQVLYMLGKRN